MRSDIPGDGTLMEGLCPTCLDDLDSASAIILGPCGHGLCQPCGVAAVHVGMEAGRPFPQCVVCVDSGEQLPSAETRYGVGWLSYEALHALQLWSESLEATGRTALLRGQQPVSALLENRYCQSMLMAALSTDPDRGEVGAAAGVDTTLRSQRRDRGGARGGAHRRRGRSPRNFGGGGDDDVDDDVVVASTDSSDGGGVRESKGDDAEDGDSSPPPPPALPPALARAASVAMQVWRGEKAHPPLSNHLSAPATSTAVPQQCLRRRAQG